jgi:hypothetical protein
MFMTKCIVNSRSLGLSRPVGKRPEFEFVLGTSGAAGVDTGAAEDGGQFRWRAFWLKRSLEG